MIGKQQKKPTILSSHKNPHHKIKIDIYFYDNFVKILVRYWNYSKPSIFFSLHKRFNVTRKHFAFCHRLVKLCTIYTVIIFISVVLFRFLIFALAQITAKTNNAQSK